MTSSGQEQPLHHFNPANAVPRPRIVPFHKARYLTADQARAFLRAIPRDILQGLRDYALFLAYLATGRRNSEIRLLRWGDLEVEFSQAGTWDLTQSNPESTEIDRAPARVYYRWIGKGKSRRDQCPLPVYYAILDFLSASKRLENIRPEEFIFTPLNDHASRFPHCKVMVYSGARLFSQDGEPISARMVNSLVKKYARRAGLDPKRLTVHTLRHTAAMLRKEAGESLESISSFLGHSNISTTQIYLHSVAGRQDIAWQRVSELLGLDDDYPHKPPLPGH
jgi:site-specific recombinase XerD